MKVVQALLIVAILVRVYGKSVRCKIKKELYKTNCTFNFDINSIEKSKVKCKRSKNSFNLRNYPINDTKSCASLLFYVDLNFDKKSAQLTKTVVSGPEVPGPPGPPGKGVFFVKSNNNKSKSNHCSLGNPLLY